MIRLAHRAVGLGGRVRDGVTEPRPEQTVGEHAARDAEANRGRHRRPGKPAGRGGRGTKAMGEDQADGFRDRRDVDGENQQRGPQIQHDHGRHQLARDLADAPDAADDDHADKHCDRATPVTHVGMLKLLSSATAIDSLTCTALPMPNAATAPKTAKAIPSHLPSSGANSPTPLRR